MLAPPGANGRCDQENILAQLAGGVRALAAPTTTPLANWACMVLPALVWKIWTALMRWQARHQEEKRWLQRLEFRTFVNTLMRLPCLIVRTPPDAWCTPCWPVPRRCPSCSGYWRGCVAGAAALLSAAPAKSVSGCADPYWH